MLIGSHVSFTKKDQIMGSLEEALSYGSTTFMFYTGAPQNTKREAINKNIVKETKEKMAKLNLDYSKLIVHAPYIINLANDSDSSKYEFSINFLKEEVKRCEQLEVYNLVLHPGSHVGLGVNKGISNIIKAINSVLEDSKVTILLETMAGKGTEIGSNLEEIKEIIDGIKNKDKIGICLDTCHLNDSGYNINDFDSILDKIDQLVGLDYVKCIHINDSKNETNTHKDRHENIGFGTIGFDTLTKIINNKKLKDIPKILETPYIDKLYPPYKKEIEMIKSNKFNPNLKKDLSIM